jgi:hypothetical protein
MAPWLRSILRIGLAVVGVWAIAWFAAMWLGLRGMCGNTAVSEAPSPDGLMKAVVFERDCGATTSASTQVSILARSTPLPNTSGNAFIADTEHGAAPPGPGGGPKAKLVWLNSHSLGITYHEHARISLARESVGGISIHYSSSQ